MSTLLACIGLDVSKETLHACLLRPSGKPLFKVFANEEAGFAKLLRWAQSQTDLPLHFCLEATGSYSDALALYLLEAGLWVSVVNPARIKHFGRGLGVLNKTDRADSQVIARYCQATAPPPWRLSAPEVQALVALLRRLADLQAQFGQEHNRSQQQGLIAPVQQSIQQALTFLQTQIEQLKVQIEAHVEGHPRLKEDKQLLQSIPGIGPMAALWIMAELPDVAAFDSAQAAAAYAGLSPSERQSGTSLKGKTRLCKAGNRHLRKALFLPAMAALRYNPPVKDLFDRLVAKGKPKMVAVGAAMRKLLMIAFGVLKNRQTFTLKAAEATA